MSEHNVTTGYASGAGPPPPPEATIERFNGAVVRQTVVIEMEPFGKARPRVTKNGTYMGAEYRKRKKVLRRLFGPVLVTGLLKLSIVAIRPMPQSWNQAQRRLMVGEPAKPSPDLDNIVGAVMDALFPDNDDIIVSLEAHKVWGEAGALHIVIEKMGD
jgi:Holliday junction resolvase RusA-like endonuclease